MEIKKIAYVGELVRTPDAIDHLGIRQGLENWIGLVVDPVLNQPERCVEMVREFNPDLIIHGNTDSLNVNLGEMMRPHTKYQVFWMLDYQPRIDMYRWNEWKTGGYDAVFLSNKDQMKEWGEKFGCPCYFLTHGCVVQELVRDDRFQHKVLFVGTINGGGWYDERHNFLEQIRPFDHITADDVEGRNKIWRDMPALYHTSDCVLDVSHSWTADGYASGRFFYTGGLGACSITKRFPGCEELYPEGTKAYFDTPEEAKELI